VSAASASHEAADPGRLATRPVLTVVVPVYNGGAQIVDNVRTIRMAVTAGLADGAVELIVVSDGSIDGTAERLLESREVGIRVIHYDRNLGKGYAVKAGALASSGDWIALVDADLDLNPAVVPDYLAVARAEGLDFAIGSKRHPESVVHYPRSRRIASRCYQLLNRVLFQLDVRDTQVGLKVFRREVAEEVVPLLLVKRFAFDLELLAVATSLGYSRIRELPIRLEYRFSGSGVGSLEVVRALFDTLAVFYRLRILRTYERKRRFLRGGRGTQGTSPEVRVVTSEGLAVELAEARVDVVANVDDATGDVFAVLAPGARPAGNWLSATLPFFNDPQVAAVVVSTVAPLRGPLATRIASAVLESRLASGSRRALYLPGNLRYVNDHEADSLVVRSGDFRDARDAGVGFDEMVAWLAARDRRTIYTPETYISLAPPPLIRPHLLQTFRYACARGAVARRSRGRSLSGATMLSLLPAVGAVIGLVLFAAGGGLRPAGAALVVAYLGLLALSGIHAGLRFRSALVGAVQPFAAVATQGTYFLGFLRGVCDGLRRATAQ
jgi:glycosyltransferase involved in cell wall biosynthesis